MKTLFCTWRPVYFMAGIALISASCSPDETDSGNGLAETTDPAFTVTQTDTNGNYYRLDASNSGFIGNSWQVGEQASYLGEPTQDIFLPDAGTYNVTHRIAGVGGLGTSETKQITVATSDPVQGNLLVNGSFTGGSSPWQVLQISSGGAAWTFADGKASVSATGYNQQAIYQAVQVVAGRNYKIDMRVFGTGSVNTWFEVYASMTPPVQGSDYTAEGRRMGLSTWDGCANNTFDGLLSNVGCVGSGNVVSFPVDGTAYLVIKSGGENTGTISITGVEMRGQP